MLLGETFTETNAAFKWCLKILYICGELSMVLPTNICPKQHKRLTLLTSKLKINHLPEGCFVEICQNIWLPLSYIRNIVI